MGPMLKKKGNPNTRSRHYVKQSMFKGSDRQIRGLILKTVLRSEEAPTRLMLIEKLSGYDKERVVAQLRTLQKEGFVCLSSGRLLVV